jgi:hypothetical protein
MTVRRRKVAIVLLALVLLALASVGGTLTVLAARNRREPAREPGPTALEASLRWLARHQAPDGSWRGDLAPVCSTCDGGSHDESPFRLTGESLLAFTGSGYTPQNRASFVDPVTGKTTRFGEVVNRGILFLMANQGQDGSFSHGPDEGVDDAVATLALAEAYGITNATAYRARAEKAIEALEARRIPGGGWPRKRGGGVDAEATASAIMAEKSAQISGLEIEAGALREGLVAMEAIGDPGAVRWSRAHPTREAMALLCRIFVDKKKGSPLLPAAARVVVADPPRWSADTNDYDYWQWATLALFQFDGPSGRYWKEWNKPVARILCDHQLGAGCLDGSWDPCDADRPSWERSGGRVHATATNALTLEVYYRYASVFGEK